MLLKDARDNLMPKDNKLVSYIWTKNGKIFVRKDNDSNTVQIKDKDTILKLKQQYGNGQ